MTVLKQKIFKNRSAKSDANHRILAMLNAAADRRERDIRASQAAARMRGPRDFTGLSL
ncbi:hypothetical protein [Nesterenkonia alba]|uniref:hypothetical protein n=1 Tax=Nesterenkonia alba TaxID=515814 RepID=UPI0003B5F4A0|nr:hypothetical protein [Nesterenkonia alba]